MQKKDNSKLSMDKNERKRGRPAGKNRVPLSLEERRARNAQYERERRGETSEAMAQLAKAACCDPQISNPELLATVISRLKQKNGTESIEDLKRINKELESQIAALESRLESDSSLNENKLEIQYENRIKSESDERNTTQNSSHSDSKSGNNRRPTKYRKTSKIEHIHNARRSSTSSHPEYSTDSQDSDWSNHHLGKTLPSQPLQPTSEKEEPESSDFERTNSVSSEGFQTNSLLRRIKFRKDSENLNESESFSEKSSQADLTMNIKLLPEPTRIKTESVEEQNKISFMDPFSSPPRYLKSAKNMLADGEKAILERLGWSDFLNFEEPYSENQTIIRWPVN